MARFSAILLENFEEPQNLRRMEAPDKVGQAAISGGATITLYLRLAECNIVDATFEAHGCGVTIACGSMLTSLIKGKSVTDCKSLTPDQLSEALQGVPPDKRHCAVLSVAALHNALEH